MKTYLEINHGQRSTTIVWNQGAIEIHGADEPLRQEILNILKAPLSVTQHDEDETGKRRYFTEAVSTDSPLFPRALADAFREKGFRVTISRNE